MRTFLTFIVLGTIAMLQFQAAVAQDRPSITINHVALHVNDLKKSGEFYGNVLRLNEIPEPFKDGLHLWYSIGPGSQLHLIERVNEEAVVPGKTTHLCFRVASMEDFIANLDRLGIDFSNWPGTAKTPTIRADGVKQIYFQDPDGYVWEVLNDVEPELTKRTQVVARSDWLGFPPVACEARQAASAVRPGSQRLPDRR